MKPKKSRRILNSGFFNKCHQFVAPLKNNAFEIIDNISQS